MVFESPITLEPLMYETVEKMHLGTFVYISLTQIKS